MEWNGICSVPILMVVFLARTPDRYHSLCKCASNRNRRTRLWCRCAPNRAPPSAATRATTIATTVWDTCLEDPCRRRCCRPHPPPHHPTPFRCRKFRRSAISPILKVRSVSSKSDHVLCISLLCVSLSLYNKYMKFFIGWC